MTLNKLTDCEELVMKTIWDTDEELSCTEIMTRVNKWHQKKWKSQTVSTFLARLVSKGYLAYYRQGRVFFYRVLVPLEEYKAQMTDDYVKFWYCGSTGELIVSLIREKSLRPDEIEMIRELIHR